jgi:uncharacterized protein (DUF58 family)
MSSITAEQLRAVRGVELRTRGLVDALFAGAYRSIFRGQGMEFEEVRQYEPGDDVRHIDWNVSARLATPYVKQFTEERELTVFVVVDQSASTQLGSPRTKAALGAEVGAVLGLAASWQNDRVGALLFTDTPERIIPPRKGRRHALRFVRDLLTFEPRGRTTDLAAALTYTARLLRHRSLVVVLSDFVAPAWERPLRRLTSRHEVVAIALDDQRDVELPAAGWVEVEDAEQGTRVLLDTGDAAVRARGRAAMLQRHERRRVMLTASGADVVALDTAVPYERALRQLFAARARRGRR